MNTYLNRTIMSILAGVLCLSLHWPASAQTSAQPTAANYFSLPLAFEENRGQADARVQYLARGQGYALLLNSNDAVFRLRPTAGDGPEQELRVQLIGANPQARARGQAPLPGNVGYFVGNDSAQWRAAIRTFHQVKYESVYPGIDLLYYGQQRQLEYDFVVQPGADPQPIRLQLTGAENISLSAEGDLVLHFPNGELRQRKPVAYQVIAGQRQSVQVDYRLLGGREVMFNLGTYDRSQPLIIDPIINYATYLGGTGTDIAWGIARDSEGNLYVAGYTASTNFPTQGGASVKGTGTDAFVTKINPTGTAFVYSLYLGGKDYDAANAIAVDPSGNATVVGLTYSSNFPLTAGVVQDKLEGGRDAFVTKINATGTALLHSTLLGGNGYDNITGVAVDQSGNAYVAGFTDSTEFKTPGMTGRRAGNPAFKSTNGGDAWNVLREGMNRTSVLSLAIAPSNPKIIYAGTETGILKSTNGGESWNLTGQTSQYFPSQVRSVWVDANNPATLYVLSGYSSVYKSTDGGDTYDWISRSVPFSAYNFYALAVDPASPSTVYLGTNAGVYKTINSGVTWVAANTGLAYSPFSNPYTITNLVLDPQTPTTVYAGTYGIIFRSVNAGASWTQLTPNNDRFNGVLAIHPRSPQILYGNFNDSGAADVRDYGLYKSTDGGLTWKPTGLSVTVAGITYPLLPSFVVADPNNANTVYAGISGGYYGGVWKSTDGGTTWQHLTTGLTNRVLNALAVDPTNSATLYVGATTGSDAFAAKLNPTGTALSYFRLLGGDEDDYARGMALDEAGNAYVTGVTNSANFPVAHPIKDNDSYSREAFVTKLSPDGTNLVYSTFLGGSSLDEGHAIAVNAQGEAYITGMTYSSDFPIVNAFQPKIKESQFGGYAKEGFVAKLNAQGSALVYSSYLGGVDEDEGNGIAVDKEGNAYVVGYTRSSDFPTVGSFAAPYPFGSSGYDAFITKVSPTGSRMLYSSIFGSYFSLANGVVADDKGSAYVAGYSYSGYFPLVNPLQSSASGYEAFLAQVSPAADVQVKLEAAPSTVRLGDQLYYTLTITNNGELTATNVNVEAKLPAKITQMAWDGIAGTCTGEQNLMCQLPKLEPGATTILHVAVLPTAVAKVSATAIVSATEPDPNKDNNTAKVESTIAFTNLALTHTVSLMQVEPGQKYVYLVTIRNIGSLAAENVEIVEELPPGTTFVSCRSTNNGVCGEWRTTRTVKFATLAAGATATATFEAQVNPDVAPDTALRAVASVSALTPDNVPSNNQDTATNFVVAAKPTTRLSGRLAFSGVYSSSGIPLYLANADGTSFYKLFNDTASYGYPAWSPDGTRLAFVKNGQVYVTDADGSHVTLIPTPNFLRSNVAWSPDSTRLAYSNSGKSVFIVNSDGSNLQEIKTNVSQWIDEVHWSPDGARFLLRTYYGLYLCNVDGSELKDLIPNRSSFIGQDDDHPAWSPDGKKIVFEHNYPSAPQGINVVNVDGNELKSLTINSADAWPTWSPDGTQVAFWRNYELWLMNADGSEAHAMPAVTPFGKVRGNGAIAWQRNQSSPATAYAIYGRVVDTSGRGLSYYDVVLDGTRSGKTTTDDNGNFSFGNLAGGGNYYVSLPPSIYWAANTNSYTFTTLSDNQRAEFVMTPIRHTISGRITDPAGGAIRGVTVGLYSFGSFSQSVTTDDKGEYRFSSVYPGSGTQVRPQAAFISAFEPASVSFANLISDQTANFVGTRRAFTISGKVTDATGKAVDGATVTLSGAREMTVSTDSTGSYTFPSLTGGLDYVLTAAKSGVTLAPGARQVQTLSSNRTVNFVTEVTVLTLTNAATYQGNEVTARSFAAALGTGLAANSSEVNPYSTKFQGLTLTVQDSTGVERLANLLFVSPTMIHFEVPINTAVGEALVTLKNEAVVVAVGTVQVQLIAPAILTANGRGEGVASGYTYRSRNGTSTASVEIARFDNTQNKFVPIPILLGTEEETATLVLRTTGMGSFGSLSNIEVKIGGEVVRVNEVSYSSLTPRGRENLSLQLPRSLRGRGEVEVELRVGDKKANKVMVTIE